MVTATGAPFASGDAPLFNPGRMKVWRKANGLGGLIVQGHKKHIVCRQGKCEGCSKEQLEPGAARRSVLPLRERGQESRVTCLGKATARAASPNDAGVARCVWRHKPARRSHASDWRSADYAALMRAIGY